MVSLSGDWLSWLERCLHTAEVTGSNPVSPTPVITHIETNGVESHQSGYLNVCSLGCGHLSFPRNLLGVLSQRRSDAVGPKNPRDKLVPSGCKQPSSTSNLVPSIAPRQPE